MIENIKNFIRRVRRFGLRGPVTNLLGVYCTRFIPRKWMANLSEKRHEVIEAKICEIVDIKSCIPQPCEMKPCDTIWICWLMGEEHMPEVVKLCYRSVLKHSAGHPVVLLCEKNLKDYVDVPQVLVDAFKKGYISRTHFADKIRMSLLSQNGGFWMDATVFLTEDIPDYVFDLPLFTIKDEPHGGNVSKCRWTGFCMAAHKGCPVPRTVLNIFQEYWSKETILIDYFFIDYCIDLAYRNSQENKQLMDAVPVNNKHLHSLTPLLCEDFNSEKFAELCSDTFMFKLSWKAYTTEQLHSNPNSYYAHLSTLV